LDSGLNSCIPDSCDTSDGYFYNFGTSSCDECLVSQCLECSSSLDCSVCAPTYTLQTTPTYECIAPPPTCHSTCASCSGPSQTECSACDSSQNLCLTADNECLTCPPPTCHSTCASCSGPSQTECSACDSSQNLCLTAGNECLSCTTPPDPQTNPSAPLFTWSAERISSVNSTHYFLQFSEPFTLTNPLSDSNLQNHIMVNLQLIL
jgi:hypothetical protein